MEWRHKAACRKENPELFFPVGDAAPALAQIADAKLICARCPVVAECLSWALKNNEEYGVWGNKSEWERRKSERGDTRIRNVSARRVAPQRMRLASRYR